MSGLLSQRHSVIGSQIAKLELPPYESPKYALTVDAQRKLDALHKGRFDSVKKYYEDALENLAVAANGLGDALVRREREAADNKRKRDNDEGETGDEDGFERFRSEVDGRTRKMEMMTRKLIDRRETLEYMEEGIKGLKTQASQSSQSSQSSQAASQRRQAASQARSRRGGRRRGGNESEDDDSDPDPTLPGTVPPTAADEAAADDDDEEEVPIPSLHKTYHAQLESKTATYKAYPAATRYAEQNSYIQFRKAVHDGLRKDADMPHARTWFTPDGKPANLTSTDLLAQAAAAGDEDSELILSRAKMSLKCPITLLPFERPVTSTVCRHSFESEAVLDMIRRSVGPPRGEAAHPGGAPARWLKGQVRWILCPVSGCHEQLREGDLREDRFLREKVKRMLREDGEEGSESRDEGEQDGSEGGHGDGFESIDEEGEDE
ncbi:hypothetical protein EJ05DRAFT_478673 [Pseudovirgaria hyperparasitica]|uniref:SP-RING-type domain-containing protein n=1 Tax=Pseudovirgaria hyperparasitica TaxID=470096 RepID=A0A6A6VZN8_9PEZI|nr:uncharacterized protein EJ05DRAFT_478673 [Pseudovirgaria hyperparasitica]KAF2755715.1 hypothetical protein EJ05DRAFT_478673 [Pseudovirgaria hyperparasitica]